MNDPDILAALDTLRGHYSILLEENAEMRRILQELADSYAYVYPSAPLDPSYKKARAFLGE